MGDVHFEKLTDGEILRLSNPKPDAKPLSEKEAVKLHEQNTATIEEIGKLHETMQSEIAKFADYRPELRDQKTSEVRARFQPEIDKLLKTVGGNADVAQGAKHFATREAELRAATFDADPVKNATVWSQFAARMARVNEVELAAFAEEARTEKSLAKACIILEELHVRGQNVSRERRLEIDEHLRAIPTSAGRVRDILTEISDIQPRRALRAAGHGTTADRYLIGLHELNKQRAG